MIAALVLRDIHRPPAPSWWPPAPGWWALAAAVLLVGLGAWWWARSRHRRRHAIARLFDESLEAAGTPQERLARMSELLRRAARRIDPAADRLQGAAWRAFLDREPGVPPLDDGEAALLAEGAYRPDVDAQAVARVEAAARTRFFRWMGVR